MPPGDAAPALVLASTSAVRARLLRAVGVPFEQDPSGVDERAHDQLLAPLGPEGLALHLARLKAAAVAERHPRAWVLAADQLGVVDASAGHLLHQAPDEEAAVAQLLGIGGTRHHLVSGLVLHEAGTGDELTATTTVAVTMRPIAEAEARAYVAAHRPLDTAGSYRIEDGDADPRFRFVTAIEPDDPSAVQGLPLEPLRRLLRRAGLVPA